MFKILVVKELKAILLSPKFVATFGVCALLIMLSLFVGVRDYTNAVDQYETAQQLLNQEIMEETSWWGIDNKAYREPSPMQVFVSGINNDVGRLSDVSTWREIKLKDSNYSNDTLFAVFRFIDFTFIVQVVLSLFAILFTYDAINGERESGTLKLAFSNAVPRGQYVLAKFVGSWLGLTVPLLIPLLLAVLVVLLLRIPMEAIHWVKFATLMGASVLYFTFFIAFGILVSALTKRSSVSFLVLLVAWILFVLIVPRAATMAAGQLVQVPGVAEIESQKDRFSTDRWDQYRRDRTETWQQRQEQMAGMSDDQQQQFRDANENRWQEEDNSSRQAIQEDIAEFSRKLNEDLRNQKLEQERLAFTLSRFSPASAYQLTAMNLGGTNTSMKTRYEDAIQAYRTTFSGFVESKRQEEMEKNRRSSRGRGMRFMGSSEETLDATEMPMFEAPKQSFNEAIAPSIIDLGLLSLFSIAAFAGAFVAFLRYDVR